MAKETFTYVLKFSDHDSETTFQMERPAKMDLMKEASRVRSRLLDLLKPGIGVSVTVRSNTRLHIAHSTGLDKG